MKCKPQLQFNSNLTTTIFFYFFFKILRTKGRTKINKQTDRVFFHTPKLDLHIVLNV